MALIAEITFRQFALARVVQSSLTRRRKLKSVSILN